METNCAYAATLIKHKMFSTVRAELKKQVHQAIESQYLTQDPDMGFADVTIIDMLVHLKTECGTTPITSIEPEEPR
jgi:hypothetical protein